MGNVRIELNNEYVREVLLKGEQTKEICRELAEGIASNYDGNADVSVYVGQNRCNVSVSAISNNNDLLKAMGGKND